MEKDRGRIMTESNLFVFLINIFIVKMAINEIYKKDIKRIGKLI